MDTLYENMQRQLDFTANSFVRYLYPHINWDARMLALVGPRGVGKTTLFLQRIKRVHDLRDTLYITADHLYFADHTLLEVADRHVKNGGRYLFIDEVHKYPDWSRELKAAYDAYPELHIYFTGSSVLDIEKGEADLSRRAPTYRMQGLSFREFLAIRYGVVMDPLPLENVLANEARIPGVAHPLPLFGEYLQRGYYPFGDDPDFPTELSQVIARTLEVDIPTYANMTVGTGRKLLKLMAVVSTLVPFKPNLSALAGRIGVSRNNIEDYLVYLEKAGMIAQLRSPASGIGALGKTEKIYLDNPNILHCLSEGKPDVGTVRETFFFNQMRVVHDVRASSISDFEAEGVTFEVGGRTKGREQLQGAARGYVVADGIERGHGDVVPLWAFGLMY